MKTSAMKMNQWEARCWEAWVGRMKMIPDTVERERETVATIALLAERGKVSWEMDVLAIGME